MLYTQIPNERETDNLFGALPSNLWWYLNTPRSIFRSLASAWPEKLPQPERVLAWRLLLLGLGLGAALAAWRWRQRWPAACALLLGIIVSSTFFKHALRYQPPLLSSAQEKALGLDKVTVTANNPVRLMTSGPPQSGYDLNLQPVVHDLPPLMIATVGSLQPLLKSDHWQIRGYAGLFGDYYGSQSLLLAMREFPSFREVLLGTGVRSLTLNAKDAANPNDAERVLKQLGRDNFSVFPFGNVVGPPPVAANWYDSASVLSELAVPVNNCRLLTRLPLYKGAHWRQDGTDLRLVEVLSEYKTVRNSSGTGRQWTGCTIRLWHSALAFDHQGDRGWRTHVFGGPLVPLLFNPKRLEMISDMEAWDMPHLFSGTPVAASEQFARFSLHPSRIGTVDEDWLDDAELVLVRMDYMGTVKRAWSLENLKPELEK